ncbi:MAG: ferritin [Planctomycetota bacterium]
MPVSTKMNNALNQQVSNEFNAAYKYRAMAFSFADMGLKIFAKRFEAQADEERGHALKIAKYIQDVDAKVVLEAVAKPKNDYKSAKEIVEAALKSEITVTNQINDLVALAIKENDYATRNFLEWFVEEQVEEVASMRELLQWVKMAGEANLFQLENRIAQSMS